MLISVIETSKLSQIPGRLWVIIGGLALVGATAVTFAVAKSNSKPTESPLTASFDKLLTSGPLRLTIESGSGNTNVTEVFTDGVNSLTFHRNGLKTLTTEKIVYREYPDCVETETFEPSYERPFMGLSNLDDQLRTWKLQDLPSREKKKVVQQGIKFDVHDLSTKFADVLIYVESETNQIRRIETTYGEGIVTVYQFSQNTDNVSYDPKQFGDKRRISLQDSRVAVEKMLQNPITTSKVRGVPVDLYGVLQDSNGNVLVITSPNILRPIQPESNISVDGKHLRQADLCYTGKAVSHYGNPYGTPAKISGSARTVHEGVLPKGTTLSNLKLDVYEDENGKLLGTATFSNVTPLKVSSIRNVMRKYHLSPDLRLFYQGQEQVNGSLFKH